MSTDGGVRWSRRPVPGRPFLYGVTCRAPGWCVAVGDRGAVAVTTDRGREWRRRPSGTTEPLAAVACPSTSVCIAVGEAGAMVRSVDGGRRWRAVASHRVDTLVGLACPTARHCLAVGTLPIASLTDDAGARWQQVTMPVLALVGMRGVACTGPDWCLAVGTNAVVLSSSDGGDQWQVGQVPVTDEVHGVSCTPSGSCVVVGSGGQVATEATPGGPWVARSSGTGEMLLAASCVDPTCIGVGGGGTVVRSVDGGSTWRAVAGVPSAADPVPVLFAGDSAAYTLADGLAHQAGAYGLALTDDGLYGCGILRGGPILVAGEPMAVTGPCGAGGGGWPSLYRSAVAEGHPRVAVLLLGRWDTMDRRHDGRWIRPGTPGFAAYFSHQLDQAIDVLSGGGAHVVLLTTPVVGSATHPSRSTGRDVCREGGRPIWCEDLPRRVAVINQLLREGAARSGGRATVVDFGARVNPRPGYVRRVDGVTVRLPDGIHFGTPGTDWLAGWLLPRLRALATGQS